MVRTAKVKYSIWIPTFFIFQLVTFYSTSIKKALYIYR